MQDSVQNGDEHRWIEIVKEAFGDYMSDWSAEKFVERYASSPLFKEDGFFFIRHKERYVATAFAWQEKTNSSEGRLHWLAVLPEYHRRGLGRTLALHVLYYHKDHGKQSVCLKTEIYRHSAIKLYKDIGFVCVAKGT
ncbi:Mycothiol acetyltransferase [Stylophora pistillata]|uniref:Mycothiol acetyltransferase n=1 Tax=Stylophora pistillata TaxID=50429 RepID=A0A2B4SZP7_STYPI|nr:Mycothiol acetyltransferase [Stylophora pistillata]